MAKQMNILPFHMHPTFYSHQTFSLMMMIIKMILSAKLLKFNAASYSGKAANIKGFFSSSKAVPEKYFKLIRRHLL
jgi:hypothetical protein